MILSLRRPALLGVTMLALLVAACSPGAPGASPAATRSSPDAAPGTPAEQSPHATGTLPVTAEPSVAPVSPGAPASSPAPTASPTPAPAILVGAGDIGECGTGGPAATARVIGRVVDEHPDAVVFTAGDDAYPDGSTADFARCYEPWWGRFLDRTRPAAGNHDWHTASAAGYRAYFGDRAGPKDRTWYAYDAGSWRVIVLDSDCAEVGGCGPSSPQGRWLADELAAHPVACTLAIWHHPRFSSGPHGNQEVAAPLFDALYVAGADLVVGGHDHDYERFAPQDPVGRPDPGHGIREFVVGTGGAHLYPTLLARRNSEVRHSASHGVLVLELGAGRYSWRFEPAGDEAFADSGTGACH